MVYVIQVHLVGFIIAIYHDARPHERQNNHYSHTDTWRILELYYFQLHFNNISASSLELSRYWAPVFHYDSAYCTIED